jgi:hypothetical protein
LTLILIGSIGSILFGVILIRRILGDPIRLGGTIQEIQNEAAMGLLFGVAVVYVMLGALGLLFVLMAGP